MIGRVVRRWRRHYGAHPLHLIVVLMVFAVVGYVVTVLLPDPTGLTILIWFLGAVVVHDALLFPIYALLDRTVAVLHPRRGRRPRRVPLVNHVRLPAMFSALLLVIFLPSITRDGEPTFLGTSGHGLGEIPTNWLLLTAGLFGVSAVIYALRLLRLLVVGRRRPVPGEAAQP